MMRNDDNDRAKHESMRRVQTAKKKKKKHEWMGSHQRNDIYSHISLYHLHATMGAAGDDTIGANNESRKTTRRDFIRGT